MSATPWFRRCFSIWDEKNYPLNFLVKWRNKSIIIIIPSFLNQKNLAAGCILQNNSRLLSSIILEIIYYSPIISVALRYVVLCYRRYLFYLTLVFVAYKPTCILCTSYHNKAMPNQTLNLKNILCIIFFSFSFGFYFFFFSVNTFEFVSVCKSWVQKQLRDIDNRDIRPCLINNNWCWNTA